MPLFMINDSLFISLKTTNSEFGKDITNYIDNNITSNADVLVSSSILSKNIHDLFRYLKLVGDGSAYVFYPKGLLYDFWKETNLLRSATIIKNEGHYKLKIMCDKPLNELIFEWFQKNNPIQAVMYHSEITFER